MEFRWKIISKTWGSDECGLVGEIEMGDHDWRRWSDRADWLVMDITKYTA